MNEARSSESPRARRPERSEGSGAQAYAAIARRRLGRIAVVYAALTAVMVAMNVVTHGPTWWYFAAAGFGFAIVMQALRLRR